MASAEKGKKEKNKKEIKNNSKQFYLRRVGSVYSPQGAINVPIHVECTPVHTKKRSRLCFFQIAVVPYLCLDDLSLN